MAAIKRKIDEIQADMDREGKGQLFRRLRRERAKQLNLQDERQEKLDEAQLKSFPFGKAMKELDLQTREAEDVLLQRRDVLESHQQARYRRRALYPGI